MVDTAAAKYPTYMDTSRGYVVPNSTNWPYSVSPSSGIIQPIQVMGTQLDLGHKECGKLAKHPSVDGLASNHSSSPGLVTPKMEEMKGGDAVNEMPRQTVLMWGSNHVHASPPTNRSPAESHHEYGLAAAPQTEGCDLKGLEMGDPEMCKWNGEGGKPENGERASPRQQHHSSHHSHHNSRVVMVL